jgi:Zn-dependent M28 family amino/carboxypeptidase
MPVVSAVIEAARILSDHCFDYTILYALWDNEEDGGIGSDYYAQIAYSEGYTIAGVLNIEMLGYDSNNDMKFEINTNNMPASLALKDELISK